jgi:Methyladenine glycosylase/SdrD B-like domain
MRRRCGWARDPLDVHHHDEEWGVPEYGDRRLFEFLILEGAQAGLSWLTILRKRDGYRRAFAGFDPEKGGPLLGVGCPSLAGQRWHRAPSRQDRGRHRQRPRLLRDPARVRQPGPLPLALRRRYADPERVDIARRSAVTDGCLESPEPRPDEAGLPLRRLAGWQIHLFSSTDPSLHLQTTTDVNGDYSFTELGPGLYTACETLQSGWVQTAPGGLLTARVSGDLVVDCSGFSGVSGLGYAFIISGDETISGNDFGNRLSNVPATGQIGGLKWNDLNGNGVRDAGEPALAGWQIHLFSNADPSFHQQATTGAEGTYNFTGLALGTYTVCETLQASWTQTAPTSGANCSSLTGVSGFGYTLTLTANQSLQGNNFGNRQTIVPPTGQIGGLKWNDLNSNGIREADEPVLAGWQIHLFSNADPSFHQQATTGAEGTYNFTGLAPGAYTVCETVQVGWVQTAPTAVDCSGRDGVSGLGYALTLTENQNLQGIILATGWARFPCPPSRSGPCSLWCWC